MMLQCFLMQLEDGTEEVFILDLICIGFFKKRVMKSINIFLIIISGMIIETCFVSCESNTYEEITTQTINPTYVADIKPIMTANCTNCHSIAGGQNPYLETYDQVKDAIVNGVLIQEIEAPSGQGMPQNLRMPQAKIDLINQWVSNGFINQ